MRQSRLKAIMALGVGAAAIAAALPAFAQDQDEDEIIVTAQRRAESLQDVPLSVTAATGEMLEDRNIVDISRLDVITPGFTYGRSGIDSRPAMRGVRTENIGVNGDTTIGYFIDGVYQSRAAQASASFVDVARVEVQRGPQGTLYGRNTFGGNVSVITNAPDVKAFDAGAALQYGSFETIKADGHLNLPLGDVAGFRLAGAFAKGDGYVENAFNEDADLFDTNLKYIRGAFRLQPSDALDIVIRADLLDQGGNGGSAFGYKIIGSYYNPTLGLPIFNSTPLFLNTRPNNRDGVDDNPNIAGVQDLGIPIFARTDPFTIDNDYKSFLELDRKSATVDASWNIGPVTLRSITGFIDFDVERSQDSDFSRNTIAVDYQLTASESLSQEAQILSNHDGPLSYVLGIYYLKDELRGVFINQQLPPVINGAPANGGVPFGGSFYDDQQVEVESLAYYGQLTFALTDRLRATAGVRYTEDDKSFRVYRPAVQSAANAIGVILTNAIPFDFDPGPGVVHILNADFVKTTWRAGLDFDVTEDNLLYFSASTGFRSGGFNTNTAAQVQRFRPEEVMAYEVGSKNRFGDLTLNLAAFWNQYDDLQEQRQVPVGSTTASIIFNAAEARSYGVEAEAMWSPTDRLNLGATLSVLDAEYTDFRDAPLPGGFTNPVVGPGLIDPTRLPPGFTCAIVAGSVTPGTPNGVLGCDLSGNKIPYSPNYSGTVYGSYDIDLGSLGTLTPYAAVTFSGAYYGQPFNTVLERTDAFARVDLSLEWSPTDALSIRGFVDNVTNEEILNRAVYGGGAALQGSWQPPRVWGVRISVKQ